MTIKNSNNIKDKHRKNLELKVQENNTILKENLNSEIAIFEQENEAIKQKDINCIAILPAYNLEYCIEDIVQRTMKFVDKVVVITDGSSDNTNYKAKVAGAECPSQTNIRGKGFAIRKGIKFSKQFMPKYIILMDSDEQHFPEEIPILIKTLRKNKADMVIGSRIKGILKTSLINRFGNYFLNIVSFIITGKWFSDIESGFRAFIAKKLYNLNLDSNFYEIECELLMKSINKGYKIEEVPITVSKSVPGITLFDGIKICLYVIKIALSKILKRVKMFF